MGSILRFSNKWLANGKTRVRDALKASGGEVHYVKGNINKYVVKVGISDSETIEPWDPARYRHDKPTLVLTGSADTVPAGKAADYYFLKALAGARTLIEYPGIGHTYALPLIPPRSPTTIPGISNVCIPSDPDPQKIDKTKSRVRDCLIYTFLEMSPDKFNNPNDNKILSVIMQDDASICYQDQNMAQGLPVARTCPRAE